MSKSPSRLLFAEANAIAVSLYWLFSHIPRRLWCGKLVNGLLRPGPMPLDGNHHLFQRGDPTELHEFTATLETQMV